MTLRRPGIAPVLAVLSAVLILGPALLPGLVLTYDIAWSPDARLTPAVLGLDTPAPRVVPSDAVVVLVGKVLTPGVTQKLVLLGVLVAVSWGALRLLREVLDREPGRVAAVAAVLVVQWNPFVAERLAMGQWTVLWGYALVPWAWAAALRARRSGSALAVAVTVVVAGLGGANTLLIVALALLPVLVWPPLPPRTVVVAVATLLGSAAGWALPALGARSAGDASGVDAFAARADGPLGLLGSVLSGGGIWNVAAWPTERASWVLACGVLVLMLAGAATIVRYVRASWAMPLVVGAVPWLVLVLVSGWDPLRGLWDGLLAVPGGGLLRDSQKLVAPWVVLCGLGIAVLAERLSRAAGPGRTALSWLTALAAVPLALSSALGLSGQLRAEAVPSDLRSAARVLSEAPPGRVGLLPWNQYRRYAWNGDRISLSVVPRMVDQPVLLDDSLPLRDRRVAGERGDAAAVSRAIARGIDPVTALRRGDVRYLVIERGAVPAAPRPPADGRVIAQGPHVTVVELPDASRHVDSGWTAARVAGGLVSIGTALLVVVLAGGRRAIRRRRVR